MNHKSKPKQKKDSSNPKKISEQHENLTDSYNRFVQYSLFTRGTTVERELYRISLYVTRVASCNRSARTYVRPVWRPQMDSNVPFCGL